MQTLYEVINGYINIYKRIFGYIRSLFSCVKHWRYVRLSFIHWFLRVYHYTWLLLYCCDCTTLILITSLTIKVVSQWGYPMYFPNVNVKAVYHLCCMNFILSFIIDQHTSHLRILDIALFLSIYQVSHTSTYWHVFLCIFVSLMVNSVWIHVISVISVNSVS